MIELIKELLTSDAGSFGFMFAFIILMFFVIWKVSAYNTKFRSVDKIDASIDKMQTDIQYLKGTVQILNQSLNPLAQSKSPITLTDRGKEIYKNLNIDEMVINHWDKIKLEIEERLHSSSNPYDIQVACFDYSTNFINFLDSEELDKLKKHAYSVGLPLNSYSILFGVSFRDKMLKDKGHEVDDVDKYDPEKIND